MLALLCSGESDWAPQGAGACTRVAVVVVVVINSKEMYGAACRCRAEVIVVCDGIIGHRYYLSSGLFENFGPT